MEAPRFITAKRLIFAIILIGTVLVVLVGVNLYSDRTPKPFRCGVADAPEMNSVHELPDSLLKEFPIISKGKALFEDNCKSCHTMHEISVGPPLAGIGNRRDRKWIHHFVRNSRGLIASGDSTAVALFNEYGMAEMTIFPTFTDEEIDAIIKYAGAEDSYR